MKFHTQPLLQQATVGEILRRTRDQKQLKIHLIARKLNIAESYLVALEQGRYNDLPSPVYIKNYLKKYVAYLELPWKQVERLYEQEIKIYHDTPLKFFDPKRLQSTKRNSRNSSAAHHRKALLIPRAVKIGLLSAVSLAIATYFLWGVVRFVSPPALEVSTPNADMIVTDHRFTIEGKSQIGAIVTINGQKTTLDPSGKFNEPLILHEGLNTIRVSASTPRSREHIITRYIIYEPVQESIKK